eukprot:1162131-Pelagomonas_calceolata.AAC.11
MTVAVAASAGPAPGRAVAAAKPPWEVVAERTTCTSTSPFTACSGSDASRHAQLCLANYTYAWHIFHKSTPKEL